MSGTSMDDGAPGGSLACPTCGAPAAPPAGPGGRSPRPFCSRRCANIDLGRWFQGRYAIPAVEGADDSIVEPLAGAGLPREEG
ncbi:MAG: DNA gyrase inhibitor YacG [Pseudomonadota bacterium]|nr:DNA gyrase inhibitor YacG [Pseudomonadota bacterium]